MIEKIKILLTRNYTRVYSYEYASMLIVIFTYEWPNNFVFQSSQYLIIQENNQVEFEKNNSFSQKLH